jgi:hypothetical protein
MPQARCSDSPAFRMFGGGFPDLRRTAATRTRVDFAQGSHTNRFSNSLDFLCLVLVWHRHPRWVRRQVGFRDLTLWSFLVASAHGTGLMVLPVLLGSSSEAAEQMAGHHHIRACHLSKTSHGPFLTQRSVRKSAVMLTRIESRR